MVIVDAEEWIVHPKSNQRQTTAGDVPVDANTVAFRITPFRETLQTCLRKIMFLFRLIDLCSVAKDRRAATGIVTILHFLLTLILLTWRIG